ncbi:MAG: hypothetical protein IT373_26820 [Polyangiaceae bacterium]|nr:hypothetical protein [Polyangiaceae bacterium]
MMRSRPKLLLLFSVVTALGLVALIAVQTGDALGHVARAATDKAETLERTMVSAIRGVARYGRDKEERIAAVLEEIARDPQVVSVVLRDGDGAVAVSAGRGAEGTGAAATGGDERGLLVRTTSFELDSACGLGCGAHLGPGAPMPPGSYELVLRFDPSAGAEVRSVILLEAGIALLLLLFAAGFATALVRSTRHRERLLRRVELAQQKTESLESLRLLATGLAHEIRNPLGAIRGFAQLTHEQSPDGEARERTAIMLSELDRVSERLEEFLAFARPREVRRQPVDLRRLCDEVATLLGPDAQAAGIELSVEAAPGEVVVEGDPAQLKELLLNLALNAVEACHEGGRVRLRVRAGTGEIALAVEDDGRGIASEDLPRVFEPYFTTRAHGSGLGLAISKRIAEGHGATLHIDSAPDRGTTATLLIPTSA